MIDRKEIELLIRAHLEGGKDLESITKSIEKLEKAIEGQATAAKKGESSIDELKGSLEALKAVQNELSSKASLIGNFQRLAEQITKTQDRVTRTTKAYEDYRVKLEKSSEVTDKQQDRLIKLSQASDRAKASLERQLTTQQNYEKTLRDAGIATNDLANAELRVRTAAASLGAVYRKNQDAIASYATDVRAAREAERQLAQEQAFQQKLTDAAKLAKASDYVSFWTNALEQADRTQAQLKADSGLRKTADDAEKAASSYNTLARAADTLRPKQQSLRDVVSSIIDPTGKAISTIDGLEKEVGSLAKTVGEIQGPVKDYRATLETLNRTQKAVGQQAGLIDNFQKQVTALRAARTEYVNARAQVSAYAAEVRKGGESGQQFVRALEEAQVKARQAAGALSQQLSATRVARDALREAGFATNDLSGSQQRLTNTARAAVTATQGLGAAVKQYGVEVERTDNAKRKSFLFGEGGRTTLSLIQRIRGEILSLAAAYVGLFGVIRLGQGAIDATSTRESVRNQLSISVGNDRKAIDAEYNYVKQQSDRIGIEFERTAKGYAKFAASAALAGRSRQEIRYIFETFAEVGKVANISADDLDGVFRALEQIYSKGKIQAEELRGQLGDRLFGAFQIAAKALEKQFPDLNKALENGQVSASQLVRIAEQYRKTVAEQLPSATENLAAQQARLNNEVFDFKLAVGEAGFIDAYTNALKEITNFLRSDDGKEFAKDIGEGFKVAAEGAILLAQNMDTVIGFIKSMAVAYAGLIVARNALKIPTLIQDFKQLAGMIGEGGKQLTAFASKWPMLATAVKYAVGVGTAALIGWEIGKILNEKFVEVRAFGVSLVTGLAEVWAYIKGGFDIAMSGLPAIAKNVGAHILNTFTYVARKALGIFSKVAAKFGFEELQRTIDGAREALTFGYDSVGEATSQARQRMSAEVANIRAIRNQMFDALIADQNKTNTGPNKKVSPDRPTYTTQNPGVTPDGKPTGPTEGEINKRARLIEEITRSLEALDARIDRSQTETLDKQLEAIDTQYAALARKIQGLGGAEAKAFMTQLTSLTNELRKVTSDKFNKALLDEQQSLYGKLEQLEATAGRKEKLSLQSRQNAIRLQYQDLYRELTDLRLKFFNNNRDTTELDAAKARIDAGVQELVNLEEQKYRLEQLNALEETRKNQIAAVNAEREAGIIQEDEAVAKINAINTQAIPSIQAAANATIQWAMANQAVFGNQEALDQFIAKVNLIKANVTNTQTEFTKLEQTMISGSVNAVNSGLNQVVDGLQGIVTRQQTVAQGFYGMLAGFANFAAQFLRDIAVMIIKMQIFKALSNAGGFWGQVGQAGLKTMGLHSGGVVGSANTWSRANVSPAWFAGAPKYHSGGIVGLKPDEYPAILQRGEEVLDKESPRNIMNGGAAFGGNSAPVSAEGVKFVLVDDRSRIPEAMNNAEGEKVIVQALRRNAATIKQILK